MFSFSIYRAPSHPNLSMPDPRATVQVRHPPAKGLTLMIPQNMKKGKSKLAR